MSESKVIILMDLPGVKGETSIEPNFKQQILVESLSWNTGDQASLGVPSKGEGGDDDFSDSSYKATKTSSKKEGQRIGLDSLTVGKYVDSATPSFLNLSFQKKTGAGSTVTIRCFRAMESTSGTIQEPFMVITLSGSHVTSQNVTVNESGATESITLSFNTMRVSYYVFDSLQRTGVVTKTVTLTKS
jgi:type VI protein secretion system component Hcp